MPLIQQTTDALAFLDPDPPSRDAIESLVRAELPPEAQTALHPSVPASYSPEYPAGITAEHSRIAAGTKRAADEGVSTARYEALDPPDGQGKGAEQAWRDTLRSAYASSAHLDSRAQNLELLEQHGRNAWLVANWQLEPAQAALDAELAAAKRQVEEVQAARRAAHGAQSAAAAEMEALEGAWREGVGRVVQVEVASEGLRRQILERRREGAV